MKKYISILAMMIAFAGSDWGQEKTGSIRVNISDAIGSVIPNAKASLIQNGRVVSTATGDSDGRYEFKDVPSGDFWIEVRSFAHRPFRKQVSLKNSHAGYTEVVIAMEPCSDDPDIGKTAAITQQDRVEIVRQLFDLSFGTNTYKTKTYYFVPTNVDLLWLSATQKAKLVIKLRAELQAITEKDGSLLYYHVGQVVQRGGCVVASMLENYTVRGQLEDANMSGGETIYEFRKVNGRWVGEVFAEYVS